MYAELLGDVPALLLLPAAIGCIGRQMIRAHIVEQDGYYDTYLLAAQTAQPDPEPPDFSTVPVLSSGLPPWSAEPEPGAGYAVAISPPQREDRSLIGPRVCARRVVMNGEIPGWAQDELGAVTTAAAVKAIFANL